MPNVVAVAAISKPNVVAVAAICMPNVVAVTACPSSGRRGLVNQVVNICYSIVRPPAHFLLRGGPLLTAFHLLPRGTAGRTFLSRDIGAFSLQAFLALKHPHFHRSIGSVLKSLQNGT